MFAGTKKVQQIPSAQLKRNNVKSNKQHTGKIPARPKRKWGTTSVMEPTIHQELVIQPANLASQQQVVKNEPEMSSSRQDHLEIDGKIVPLLMQSGDSVFENENGLSSQNSQSLSTIAGGNLNNQAMRIMNSSQGEGAKSVESSGALLGQQQYAFSAEQTGTQERASQLEQHTMGEFVNGNDITEGNLIRMGQSNHISDGASASLGNLQATGVNNALGQNLIVRPRYEGSKSSAKTKILYYDPLTAMVNGQLYVPKTVYDAGGNEVDLNSYQSTNTRIYIEPPSFQQAQKSFPLQQLSQDSLRNTNLETQQLQRDFPSQQLSRNEFQHIASEPPAQDQYIIIATVAVMALLVGALSARRLRSRNFLSSCIENESLEDEIAYDVATTAGDYSTFSAGNWRGDLEKFDV